MGGDYTNTLKALENSPKGRLHYDTGWDERPNAVNALITNVQEVEVDKPNRVILENAIRVIQLNERYSLSPRSTLTSTTDAPPSRPRGRHSLPGSIQKGNTVSPISPSLLSSVISLKVEHDGKTIQPSLLPHHRYSDTRRVPEGGNEWHSLRNRRVICDSENSIAAAGASTPKLLTPPNVMLRRKKSVDGSPIFKPSPTFSSSTQTQTHSSTTSDATTATPTKNPACRSKSKKFGIGEEDMNETKCEEDLILESISSPFDYIQKVLDYEEEEKNKKLKEGAQKRLDQYALFEKESERRVADLTSQLKARKEKGDALKQSWIELDKKNLLEVQARQQNRLKLEEKLQLERKAAADAAEAGRQAVQAAAQQEQLRILRELEEQKKKEEAENLERQRQLQQAQEEKRLADEQALKAAEEQKRQEEQRSAAQAQAQAQAQPQAGTGAAGGAANDVAPGLQGLILKGDLMTYAKSTDFLKRFEDPVASIDGRDPNTKAFYIGAVKCINTPLNALADTHERDIMAKVQHFSKLISGEAVSGGGSMTTLFQCTIIPNGQAFVMKTLAFRFVKKSEADVTRGKSTVQPLADVGVHLCKQFPQWAALVQANMYKLCPFLVPFSYPQGEKTIQEYARELGHDLSGAETAIQQTFLERLKGYTTLYSLMVLKFHQLGPFDVGDATNFFTLGGAWQIISHTMLLNPQVDVTATVLHTLLDILDDTLYAVYRAQFSKLMRILILHYLPKIKAITPPARSGSLSRLQIYLEKKFAV